MHAIVARPFRAIFIIVALSACGEHDVDPLGVSNGPKPATVVLSPDELRFESLHSRHTFVAAVLDSSGRAVPHPLLVWTSSDPAVATVDTQGVVTALSAGFSSIVARAGSVSDTAVVAVVPMGVPTDILLVSGDGQTARVLERVPQPFVVQVRDRNQNPVAGDTVRFEVIGGSVDPVVAVTDSQGRASTIWTLGAVIAEQSLRAWHGGPFPGSIGLGATILPDAPHHITANWTELTGIPSGTVVAPRPSLRVFDRHGNGVPDVQVTFAVTKGGGTLEHAAMTTGGWIDGEGYADPGDWMLDTAAVQELTATVAAQGMVNNPITFTVHVRRPGKPAAIVATTALAPTSLEDYPINAPPSVRVVDAAGNPVWDAAVRFTVTSGGGSVAETSVLTKLDGVASPGSWTIRSGTNTLTASVADVATPVTFQVTGVPSTFTIDVRYPPDVDQATREALDSAAARWSRVIYGDIPDMPVNVTNVACSPSVQETIDDIAIYVALDSIDGPGQVMVTGTPCVLRPGSALPAVAVLRFDRQDIPTLVSEGALPAAALHAMAHALGFGTIWSARGLVGPAGTHEVAFLGPQALAAWRSVGGPDWETGVPLSLGDEVAYVDPLEGPAGARDIHWAPGFSGELMSARVGWFSALSVITIAQFGDLGYTINLGAASAFECSIEGSSCWLKGPH